MRGAGGRPKALPRARRLAIRSLFVVGVAVAAWCTGTAAAAADEHPAGPLTQASVASPGHAAAVVSKTLRPERPRTPAVRHARTLDRRPAEPAERAVRAVRAVRRTLAEPAQSVRDAVRPVRPVLAPIASTVSAPVAAPLLGRTTPVTHRLLDTVHATVPRPGAPALDRRAPLASVESPGLPGTPSATRPLETTRAPAPGPVKTLGSGIAPAGLTATPAHLGPSDPPSLRTLPGQGPAAPVDAVGTGTVAGGSSGFSGAQTTADVGAAAIGTALLALLLRAAALIGAARDRALLPLVTPD